MKGGGMSFVGSSSSSHMTPTLLLLHFHSHSHSESMSVSTTIFPHSRTRTGTRTRARATSTSSAQSESEIEIRVCVNRSCRKQGSFETLQTLTGIAPPNVSVSSSGCLGRCGAGPNLVLLPDAVFFSHCATPARALHTMSQICGGHGDSDSWTNSLAALALRKRADDEFDKGNFAQAHLLLSQAIDLKPCGGIHTIYKDRSAARLAMGNMAGALEDAGDALTLAPKYPEVINRVRDQGSDVGPGNIALELLELVGMNKWCRNERAYICQGDAFMDMNQYDAAEKSYSVALELDPSIRRSKSFKARVAKLQEKFIAAESP